MCRFGVGFPTGFIFFGHSLRFFGLCLLQDYVAGSKLDAGRAIFLSQTARLSSLKRAASFFKMRLRVSSIT
jgi:hypothetical protein